MKGYKAFSPNLTCRKMKYEVGKSYSMDEEPVLCKRGFHFCETIASCSRYYGLFGTDNRVCEIEASGTIIHGNDKCVTNRLLVVRELSRIEINRGIYTGHCDGFGNGYGKACGLGFYFGFGDGFAADYGNGYGGGNGKGYCDGNGGGNGDGIKRHGCLNGNGDGGGCGLGYGEITRVVIFN